MYQCPFEKGNPCRKIMAVALATQPDVLTLVHCTVFI